MQRLDSCSRAWIEVDFASLRSNIAHINSSINTGTQIMSVVKADAYGHGLLQISQEVLKAGCRWLGVAAVSEGAMLRVAGITAPIALLSASAAADARDILELQLTPLIGDESVLNALNASSAAFPPGFGVHLDIETGMGRSGVLPKNAVSLWQHAISLGITVEGISTHFSDADSNDDAHTRHQICEFNQAWSELNAAGARFKWIHIDNSASISTRYSASTVPSVPHSNLIRPGLLIYGISPKSVCSDIVRLKPILTLKARVATIRELPRGHAIGYGVMHRLVRNSVVATVPIGYGDGYPRALSNRGHILVKGKRAPILGTVCMDQTMVDVTDIPNVSAGDEAVCIGSQYSDAIHVEVIARLIGATEHEITTGLTARLPRVYLDE